MDGLRELSNLLKSDVFYERASKSLYVTKLIIDEYESSDVMIKGETDPKKILELELQANDVEYSKDRRAIQENLNDLHKSYENYLKEITNAKLEAKQEYRNALATDDPLKIKAAEDALVIAEQEYNIAYERNTRDYERIKYQIERSLSYLMEVDKEKVNNIMKKYEESI